jgi:hypothetical protein
VTGITLQLPGLQGEPGAGLAVTSLQGGDSYSVSGQTRYDPFKVRLRLGSSAPSLERAAAMGELFPDAQLTVFTGDHKAYLTLQLGSVFIGGFQLTGVHTPTAEIGLVFSALTTSGRGAASSLPAPLPGTPLGDITLAIQGLPTAAAGIHPDSVDAEEVFTVGQAPRLAFQATMKPDANAELLHQAVVLGTRFSGAQLALNTGEMTASVTFQLTSVLITSFQVNGTAVPLVQFGFTAARLGRT